MDLGFMDALMWKTSACVLRMLARICAGFLLVSSTAYAQTEEARQISDCRPAQLSAVEDQAALDQVEGGLGHHALTVAVQNISTSTCVLSGVPKVRFLDRDGRVMPVPVCENCVSYLIPKQPVEVVRLAPKAWAYLLVAYTINDNDGTWPCREIAALEVHTSRQADALSVKTREMRSCGQIYVFPFTRAIPQAQR